VMLCSEGMRCCALRACDAVSSPVLPCAPSLSSAPGERAASERIHVTQTCYSLQLKPSWVEGPYEAQSAQMANTPFAALAATLPGPVHTRTHKHTSSHTHPCTRVFRGRACRPRETPWDRYTARKQRANNAQTTFCGTL
jgi:hypothetical protein